MTSPRMRDTSHCEVTSQHFIKLHWQFATDPTPTGWKEVLWEFSALHKNTKLHNLRSFPLRLRQKQFSEILLTVLGKSYLFTTYFFWSLWIGMDIPNIYMKINTLSINSSKWTFSPHFRDTYTFRLLHLYAMFEIWLSIHVPCFHIRQKTIAKLECKSPVKCYTYKQSEFFTKRRRNQSVFHQNLPNILQNSIRWIKYMSLIYWCNNLRIARRRPLFTA